MTGNIEYCVVTHSCNWFGMYFDLDKDGLIFIYASTIWDYHPNFEDFVRKLIFIEIVERICMETKFHQVEIKNSCRPVCKLKKYAEEMMYYVKI